MDRRRPEDRKRLISSALLGLAGCAVAWLPGEGFLALAAPREAIPAERAAPAVVGSEPAPSVPTPASASPPPPPADFAPRLTGSGAQSGDVQVSLIWNDANDLDLHCVGPDGYDVYSATRDAPSPTGGRMDVDGNTACHKVGPAPTPVENIYWPAGAAPAGVYRVYVDAYQQCPAGPDVSKYRVSILTDGKRQEFEGEVVFSERKGKQLVHEFGLAPRPGAVLPPSPGPPAVPEAAEALPGGATSSHPLVRGGWAALIACGPVLALTAGTNRRLGLRPLVPRSAAWLIAAGAVAGVVTGGLGGWLDRGLHASGGPGVGFVLGWLLLGGILGGVVSFLPPNGDVKKAVALAAMSGLLGAGVYFAGQPVGGGVGRLLAASVLGVGVGLAAAATQRKSEPPAPIRPTPPPVPPKAPVPPPQVARPPAPHAKPNPPPPVARPAPPAQPRAGGPPGDGCPGCGRKNPGTPGNRHCMICDRTY